MTKLIPNCIRNCWMTSISTSSNWNACCERICRCGTNLHSGRNDRSCLALAVMPEDRPPGLSGQTAVPAVEDQRTTGCKPVCPDRRDACLPGIEAETSLIVRELTRKPEGSIERFSSRSPETLARFRHSSQGGDPDWHSIRRRSRTQHSPLRSK